MVDQNSQGQDDELLSTKAELTRIQNEFQSTKAELIRIKNEFQSTKAELTRIQSEFQSTKLELTRVQKELYYAKEESIKAPNTLQSVKEELNRVRIEKEALSNEIGERQNAIQTQTDTIQELEKEKQELLGTVGTLKTQITELQNNLEESKSQFTQISQRITELETQVNSQNVELSQLKEENKNFSSTLKSFVQASKEMLRSGALEDFPQMRELVLMAVPEYHILDIIRKEGIIELTQLQEQLKESREVIEQSIAKLIPEGLVQRAGDYIFHFHFQIEAVNLDQMSATDLFDYAMFNIANVGGEVEKIQETLLELQETLSKRYQNPIIYELLMYASAGDLNDINKVISDLKTWRQRISELKSS
ncbi:MAG: hypothetical protein ACFFCQ_05385 [Promethearchaeota archaeon]